MRAWAPLLVAASARVAFGQSPPVDECEAARAEGFARGDQDWKRGLAGEEPPSPPGEHCALAWTEGYERGNPPEPGSPLDNRVAKARALTVAGAVVSVLGAVGLTVGGVALGALLSGSRATPSDGASFLQAIPSIALPVGAIELLVGLPLLVVGAFRQLRAERARSAWPRFPRRY